MNLTNQVIEILRENMALRNRIAIELDCSEQTIRRWLNENEPDGDLTKASALKIISEETGLTNEEILTESQPVQK